MSAIKTPVEMITPAEMSKRCGMSPEGIMNALRLGMFPVGFAFQGKGGKWRYYTPRAEFERWLAGELPSNQQAYTQLLIEQLTEKINSVKRYIN